jgi:hypothetical protein
MTIGLAIIPSHVDSCMLYYAVTQEHTVGVAPILNTSYLCVWYISFSRVFWIARTRSRSRQASEDHPLDTVDALGRQRFNGMDSNFIGRFQGNQGYQRHLSGLGPTVRLQDGYRFGVGQEFLLSYTPRSRQNEEAPRHHISKLSSRNCLGQGRTRSPHEKYEPVPVSHL